MPPRKSVIALAVCAVLIAAWTLPARGQSAPPGGITMPTNTGSGTKGGAPARPSQTWSILPPGSTAQQSTTPGGIVVPAAVMPTSGQQGGGSQPTTTDGGGARREGNGPAAAQRGPQPLRPLQSLLVGPGFRLAETGPPEVPLVTSGGLPLYGGTPLVPTREMAASPNGFDIRLTYTNTTDAAQPMGGIQIADIRLGERVEVLDARHGTDKWTVLDRSRDGLRTVTGGWPAELYSPVAVIRDANLIVGTSVQYAALEYRHGVNVTVGPRPGEAGQTWAIWYDFPGEIAAGQTRVYTLSVRLASRSESWLKTLLPYRDFFKATYGGVQYSRDPRPITAAAVAFEQDTSPGNPRGFAYPNLRPDINGWRPWAKEITARRTLGYQRTMVWAASGVYAANKHRNYPANSLSPMDDIPVMRNSKAELANAASPSMQIGYWLGSATRYETGWDSAEPSKPITLGNEEEEAQFFRELNFAASLNAKVVGLGGLTSDDPYFLHTWVTKVKQKQPKLKLVAEGSVSDILHTMVGSFMFEWDVSEDEKPVLADFLLPGHEMWVSVWGQSMSKELGRRPTIAEFVRCYERYAASGYIPVDVNAVAIPATLMAAKGWDSSIPTELRPKQIPGTPAAGATEAANQASSPASGARNNAVPAAAAQTGTGTPSSGASTTATGQTQPAATAKPQGSQPQMLTPRRTKPAATPAPTPPPAAPAPAPLAPTNPDRPDH